MFQKRLHNLLLFWMCFSIYSAYSLEFDVSPNESGSLDVRGSQTFQWNSSVWSYISLAVENPVSVAERDNYYIATSGTSISASVDVLGYRYNGAVKLGIACNLLYNPNDVKEVGYVDLEDSTRLFIVNERRIQLFQPRLKASLSGNAGILQFSADAYLSPWYILSFDQDISTSTTGVPDKHSLSSRGIGNWAAAADLSAVIVGSAVSPEVRFSFESVPMAYSYLDVFGTEREIDSLILNIQVMAGGSLKFLRFSGAAPRVLIGYEWKRVQDRLNGDWIIDNGDMVLMFGLRI